MRAASVVCAAVGALVLAAGAAATFAASQQVTQAAVGTATIAAPSGLAAGKVTCPTHSSYTIPFSWTASSPTTYVDGYQIYSGPSGGPYTTLVATVSGATTTTASTTRTDAGASLYFVVQATARTWTSPTSAAIAFSAPNNLSSCK